MLSRGADFPVTSLSTIYYCALRKNANKRGCSTIFCAHPETEAKRSFIRVLTFDIICCVQYLRSLKTFCGDINFLEQVDAHLKRNWQV